MSISKTLIDRTAETDVKPRSLRAFSTFSPSGSATPFLRWISTRALTLSRCADSRPLLKGFATSGRAEGEEGHCDEPAVPGPVHADADLAEAGDDEVIVAVVDGS